MTTGVDLDVIRKAAEAAMANQDIRDYPMRISPQTVLLMVAVCEAAKSWVDFCSIPGSVLPLAKDLADSVRALTDGPMGHPMGASADPDRS